MCFILKVLNIHYLPAYKDLECKNQLAEKYQLKPPLHNNLYKF